MAETMQTRPLCRTPLVRATEHCCRPHDRGCSHEEHSTTDEIVFVRRGAFTRHVGRSRRTLNPNHVVFFSSGAPYRVSHPADGGDDCLALWVRPDVLSDILCEFNAAARDRMERFPHPDGPCDSRMHLGAAALHRTLAAGSPDPALAESAVLTLVRAAVQSAHRLRGHRPVPRRRDTQRAHADLADAVKTELSRRFTEQFSLDDLARRVHASPFHLTRVFRRQTGMSIHAYRHQLRLRAALEQLADDGCDLTDLALRLGFYDHGHFTTAFRRAFGQTPSCFRKTASHRRLAELSRNLQV